MSLFALVMLLLGASRPVAAAIPPLSPVVQFLAPNPAIHPGLGQSVALDGDSGVAGAPARFGNQVGAAYVYVRTPSDSWALAQQLLGSGQVEEFGDFVALSGDTVVVSAPAHTDSQGAIARGAVYVFVNSGGTWTLQQVLKGDVADGGAPIFGNGVAIVGDMVAVAEWGVTQQLSAVYVFVRSGTTWSLQQKLFPSNAGINAVGPVAISGDTMLVGTGEGAGTEGSFGSAYAFVQTNGVWAEQQRISSSDPSFGQSVALSGDTAVIGGDELVHILQRSNGVWSEQATLVNPDLDGGVTGFGTTVAISDDATGVLAGAPFPGSLGTVYVFGQTAVGWAQQQAIAPTSNGFGTSVALSGTTALIGGAAGQACSAYFFAPLISSAPAIGKGVGVLAAILLLGGLLVAGRRARIPARPGASG
jgi:hypothetical protein